MARLRLVMIVTTAFMAAFYVLERTGLFSASSSDVLQVLYSVPMLAGTALLFATAMLGGLRRPGALGIWGWTIMVSVTLLLGGHWVSWLTRFSAEVVITEGQAFNTVRGQYAEGSTYRGRFASVPEVEVMLEGLTPDIGDEGRRLDGIKGTFKYITGEGNKGEINVSDFRPKALRGLQFSISGFGYSPRFVLRAGNGRVQQSAFVFMKLFPPGQEDYFRLLSPHTFYVRYFPATEEAGGTAARFGVRVARNKYIVARKDIALKELLRFDDASISFDELRTWTRLQVMRDWGEPLAMAGILIGLMGLAGLLHERYEARG